MNSLESCLTSYLFGIVLGGNWHSRDIVSNKVDYNGSENWKKFKKNQKRSTGSADTKINHKRAKGSG